LHTWSSSSPSRLLSPQKYPLTNNQYVRGDWQRDPPSASCSFIGIRTMQASTILDHSAAPSAALSADSITRYVVDDQTSLSPCSAPSLSPTYRRTVTLSSRDHIIIFVMTANQVSTTCRVDSTADHTVFASHLSYPSRGRKRLRCPPSSCLSSLAMAADVQTCAYHLYTVGQLFQRWRATDLIRRTRQL
jgi:hypothetical protein